MCAQDTKAQPGDVKAEFRTQPHLSTGLEKQGAKYKQENETDAHRDVDQGVLGSRHRVRWRARLPETPRLL